MNLSVEDYIADAKSFQRYGEHETAIDLLITARQLDHDKKNEVEIEKLLCFNYRKLQDCDLALFHINNAINAVSRKPESKETKNEYAICLMNKGVVYEEQNDIEKAMLCYSSALEVFLMLYGSDSNNHGIIINALFTIGTLCYEQNKYKEAKRYLSEAILYFDHSQIESDRRYQAIIQMLNQLDREEKDESE